MVMILNSILLTTALLILSGAKVLNCGNQKGSDNLRGITLTKKTPIVNRDNSLTTIESNYNVYYYGDFLMYKINYEFDSLVNDQVVLQEMRHFFLVYHKDSSYGYKYFPKPNSNLDSNERVNTNSVISFAKFESNLYDTLINFQPDSIYNYNDEIIRVYKNPPSPNSAPLPEKHDLYFYYTKKLKDVPETFSKKMDNVKGMKLTKILIKVSGGYYKEFNMTFPPRELLQEMKELSIENKDEIINYFRKYQRQEL